MTFNFNPAEGLIIIPTRIFGPNGDTIVNLALDTGATMTLINWDIAVLLGYDPAIVRNRVQVTTGSGVEFAPQIEVSCIEALGMRKDNFTIICHTLPQSASVDGLLGLDYFRNTVVNINLIDGIVEMNS